MGQRNINSWSQELIKCLQQFTKQGGTTVIVTSLRSVLLGHYTKNNKVRI